MTVESTTRALCDLALRFGEGDEESMSRPFGVSLLIAGHDENGPCLYYTDPSGTFWQCNGKAIGSGSEGADSSLQEQYNKDMTLKEAETIALSILKQVMEEKTGAGKTYTMESEETKSADINGPKGIISSIGISIIVGWGYLLGITFTVTDISHLLSPDNDAGGYAIAEIFYQAFKSWFGNGTGGIICLLVVAVAIFFCAMSSLTSNSSLLGA